MGTSRRGGAVFNWPAAWRISQSLIASGRKQKNIQTHFHQCFFFLCFFPLVIPFPLLPCLVFLLHFPLAFHILILYSLSLRLASPQSFAPMLRSGCVWEHTCLCGMCLHKFTTFVCVVMYLFAEAQSQSSKACHLRSGLLAVFLSVSLLLCNISSLTQSGKEQDKLQVSPRVGFNSPLFPATQSPRHFWSNPSAVD